MRPAVADEAVLFRRIAWENGACPAAVHLDGAGQWLRVALLDGEVAGFAAVTPGPEVAQLGFLLVFERRRGLGIGRSLVDALRADLLAGGRRRLDVIAQPWSEGFFRRIGARRVGWLPPGDEAAWSRPLLRIELAG